MSERIKCLICGKEIEAVDAMMHWIKTGHNLWELLESLIEEGE